ncbi:hypothetical protein CcaCcLH18_03727 [Colletotrichum camelliae]|nr:hypothetical protein CcaCcLH18_03727 [Colletotrichum camelliae]
MSDATTNQAESLNQVGEATCSKRIMRYCLGKPLAPDGTDETQSVSDDDPSTGAAVPSFGRVSRWIIDDKRHETLWQFDIERLKRAAETSNVNHLRPAVEEDEMVSFSHINGGSFTQLGKVADQILYALWLFSYEDEAVLRDYGSLYLNHERGRNIFWNFERIKGHIPDLPRKTELHYMRDMDDSSEEDDEPSETPAMSQLVVTERDQYCYIVDEVTAILAHVAWNSSGSSYWRVVILACLAKISTKLKVLATQLPQAITKYVAEKKRQESDSDSDSDSEDKHPIVVNYCIDPDIQTLLASGIVTVKVLTVDGEALLWLRLIPGSGRVQHILVFGETDDTGMPVCVDLPQPGERSESLAFNRQEISWTKVLGVYNAVEKRIR